VEVEVDATAKGLGVDEEGFEGRGMREGDGRAGESARKEAVEAAGERAVKEVCVVVVCRTGGRVVLGRRDGVLDRRGMGAFIRRVLAVVGIE
jgi:hypothetical protein